MVVMYHQWWVVDFGSYDRTERASQCDTAHSTHTAQHTHSTAHTQHSAVQCNASDIRFYLELLALSAPEPSMFIQVILPTMTSSTLLANHLLTCTWDISKGMGIDPTYPHREVMCDDGIDV
jgi:hypothetical protein